jgi:hypothetical protein
MSDFQDKITSSIPPPAQAEISDSSGPEPVMQAHYTLDRADYAALFLYVTKLSPAARRQRGRRFAIGLLGGLLLLGIWAGHALAKEETRGNALANLGTFLIAFLILLPLFLLLRKYETYSALQALCRDPRIFEPTRLTFSADQLTSTGLTSSVTIQWHGVREIVEYGEYGFFFTAEREAVILPKRAFADEWQFQEFLDTARRYHVEARRFVRTEGPA